MKGRSFLEVLVTAVLFLALLMVGTFPATGLTRTTKKLPEFTNVITETQRFMGYFYRIQLSDSEKETLRKALASLPAPCCSDKSALTC